MEKGFELSTFCFCEPKWLQDRGVVRLSYAVQLFGNALRYPLIVHKEDSIQLHDSGFLLWQTLFFDYKRMIMSTVAMRAKVDPVLLEAIHAMLETYQKRQLDDPVRGYELDGTPITASTLEQC